MYYYYYIDTPGLHNKIPALKIFARGWVAQESIFHTINAKTFQGLGPKRLNLVMETGCKALQNTT